MAEILSTLDMPVRLMKEDGDVHQRPDTRLFSQEDGHVFVREPIEQSSNFEAEPEATADTQPVDRGTGFTRRQEIRVPRVQRVSTRPDERYILLKKYEGVVTSRSERSFTARMFENSNDYPVVEAEFDLAELSETDRDRAVEGAALVWTIGYGYEGSTRKRESLIYLRRLPPWTEKEIAQAKQAGSELIRGIRWK